MTFYHKIIAFLMVLVSTTTIVAQQDAQYTQYLYNTAAINPAYTGSRDALSIGVLHRSQWVGLDGAPSTQTINVHSPISESLGLGLSVVNDAIGNGTVQETYFDALFSYTVPVSDFGSLAFGLKAGGQLFNLDFGQLRNTDPTVPILQNDISNKFAPNFGVGVYYYTDTFYTGVSIPNILKTEFFDTSDSANTNALAVERLNFYWILGYVFELNPFLKFKPASLVKAVQGAPVNIDVSANFLLNDRLALGASYRWNAAFSGLLGYQISDQLLIGLSYDREISALGSTVFNDGSFEVFIRYDFLSKYKKVLTPRFF